MDLIREAVFLNSFEHQNLIKFYGFINENNFTDINDFLPKYIVLEYMNTGDLLTYLRSRDAKKVVSLVFTTN